MDKQLNARIKPELHNQIKKLSTDSKLVMNTLVENLLEIGLKHYVDNKLSVDSSSYVSKDDLIAFDDRLKKLESLIENLPSQSGNIPVDDLENLKAEIDNKLTNHEQKLNKHTTLLSELHSFIGVKQIKQQPQQRVNISDLKPKTEDVAVVSPEAENAIATDSASTLKPMRGIDLDLRFGLKNGTTSKQKNECKDNPERFIAWSKNKDKDGIGWTYNSEDGLYHPIK